MYVIRDCHLNNARLLGATQTQRTITITKHFNPSVTNNFLSLTININPSYLIVYFK